jgi:hypothetical protein
MYLMTFRKPIFLADDNNQVIRKTRCVIGNWKPNGIFQVEQLINFKDGTPWKTSSSLELQPNDSNIRARQRFEWPEPKQS